jgi:hypothetical protein
MILVLRGVDVYTTNVREPVRTTQVKGIELLKTIK